MKSVAIVVVALGLLFAMASPSLAHGHGGGHGHYYAPYYHHYHGYYGGYYGSYFPAPVVVVPTPVYTDPSYVNPYAPAPYYYYGTPGVSFGYRGPRVSVGVGYGY